MAVVSLSILLGCDSSTDSITAETSGMMPAEANQSQVSRDTSDTFDAPDAIVATDVPNNPEADPSLGQDPFLEADDPGRSNGATADLRDSGGAGAIAVPDGSPEELLEFINGLAERRPESNDRDEFYREVRRIMDARLTAADKILDANPDDISVKVIAAETKLESLRNLEILGEASAAKEYSRFAQKLIGEEQAELAQVGQLGMFRTEIDRLNGGQIQAARAISQDAEQLLESAQLSGPLLRTLSEAGRKLHAEGFREEALTVLAKTGRKFQEHDQLASEAKKVLDQAKFVMFEGQLYAVLERKDGAASNLVTTVRKLLKNPAQETLAWSSQAGQVLEMTGNLSSAAEVFVEIAAAFRQSDQPELAAQAAQADFKSRLYMLVDSDESNVDASNSIRNDLLASPELGLATYQIAQQIEFSGNTTPAGRIYDMILDTFAGANAQRLDVNIRTSLDSAKRRLSIIGEPFEITGELLDGGEFQWSEYAGKVVLVDFWATWCGPCIRELPNIKANYDRFHEQGFDVVGVNLDDDRRQVEQFLASNNLPWATILSLDPLRTGFDNPNAVRCGVDAIPFLVLVGRDGKVAAIHVRGEALAEKVNELLGSSEL